MAINVNALINSLGKTYQEIFDEGLIPYKSKPRGDSGDDYVSLDMQKEGVFLAFDRNSKKLTHVTLTLIDEERPGYVYPNQLPSPLVNPMTREWVEEYFGAAIKSFPPCQVFNCQYGWKDLYRYNVPESEEMIYIQFSHDLFGQVETITFLGAENVT
ncbi:hypothetical protein Ppb6_01524 [Photorhabdus australis subsp. thailandensis]|uniref:Pyocin immunity protein n=1 Tax=Photorhabdus australis subsp. thailandensis TaxID=2805096 RepID=A0A1C0U5U2_9GAMM|nr:MULTISPECIES: DUF6392 family protein [Photorhabdus]MDB6369070.1 DUF6392 family protein [Photorhabdus bodei]OCQ53292.1 hypothetical protein Ppb6_01524 [Photorhabdus australis subsp. thailandensis]